MSEALEILSSLRLDNGKRWGQVAEPWQIEDAEALLDTSVRRHYWTRPRGASKTTDLGGLAIALLLNEAPPSSRSFAFASDQEQAALLRDAIAGLLSRTPEVRGALKVDQFKITNPKTDASLIIMASDAASAWGLSPWLLIIDELAQWRSTPAPQEVWRAGISSLPKRPDSRLVCMTSAGAPGHWSYRVLTEAIALPQWRVSQTPGPTPWMSEADIEEQKKLLPAWEVDRLIYNRWTESDDKLTNTDDIDAAVVLDGPSLPIKGKKYVIGVDLGLVNDATVASICHREDNAVILDYQEAWQGTKAEPVRIEDIEEWLLEKARDYNKATVVADSWQGEQLLQRLSDRRVKTVDVRFSSQVNTKLALTMHQLLRNRQLRIYRDPGLLDELANVQIIETAPGMYKIEHEAGRHNDRAISLSLAAEYLVSNRPKPTPRLGAVDLAAGLGKGGHSRDHYTGRSTIGEWDYR